MTQETLASNPFMLMLNPEVVLAAMERSAMLGGLNRRTCHPLDRPVPTGLPAAERTGSKAADRDVDVDTDLN